MTYLATEMLLYLLSTAVIGLVLGWLIWGIGRGRKLETLRSELVALIEQEKEAHHETRMALDSADDRSDKAIKAARSEADRSLAELQVSLDAERVSVQRTQEELERVRAGMDDAVQQERASSQAAVDQAMATARAERAAAAEAMTKEAQSRAQIEELRLLIGAEKLAAESARTELEETRASSQAELETERSAHDQAKSALNDIRSTLARTLGSGVLDLAGDNSGDVTAPSFTRDAGGHGNDADRTGDMTSLPTGTGGTTPFGTMTDMVAAGDALNNPDLDEADIEDREGVGLDLSSTIEKNAMPDEADEESVEAVDPPSASTHGRIGFRPPPPLKPVKRQRPAIFLDPRPDHVDNLQAIDGISAEIEEGLHASGCYRFAQLADLASEDIAWLAEEIGLSSYQITAGRWVEQAKSLQSETDAVVDRTLIGPTDRQNAAG